MSVWTGTMLALTGAGHARRFERLTMNPAATQRSLLQRLIHRHAATAFGRAHGFAALRAADDYRRAVPVRKRADFRPFVEALCNGEQAVLTAETPFMFALSAGTTAAPVLTPVTDTADRLDRGAFRRWLCRAALDHPAAFAGARLVLAGRGVVAQTHSGLPCGTASGRLRRFVPDLLRRGQAVPGEVLDIADRATREFLAVRLAIGRRISFVAAPNPSALLRLAQSAQTHAETLIRAVYDGTPAVPADDPIVAAVARRLRPDRERARELERAMHRPGGFIPANYWPEVRLIACWTAGGLGASLARLRSQYPSGAAVRDPGYVTADARVSAPVRDGTASGVLAIDANFYEFVPEEEQGKPAPRTLLAHELECGRRYRLVLTTPSGLYRYDTGDLVEVTGFHQATPLVAYARRAHETARLAGVTLHPQHLAAALHRMQTAAACDVRQHRAAPDHAASRYRIYLEFAGSPPDDLAALGREIDAALAAANRDYLARRRSGQLHAPILHAMRGGWDDNGLRELLARGGCEFSAQWPTVVGEPRAEDERWIAASAIACEPAARRPEVREAPAWQRESQGKGRVALWSGMLARVATV